MSRREPGELDVPAILRVLQRHDVDFIVIGAVAAIAQGYPLATYDIDVTPSAAADNLERLEAALRDLDAKLRTPHGPIDFPVDARLLASSTVWTLATNDGDLDLVFEPAGTRGYEDLRRGAILLDLGAGEVRVASLADVIRSKEATGRAKDEAQLPAMRQTLEVVRERQARGDPV